MTTMPLGQIYLLLALGFIMLSTPIITLGQGQVYGTAGNPNTPEKEMMAAPGDPNPQVRQLQSFLMQ